MTRLASFIALMFLVAGCATPPLRVVPVATIRNEATLEYSYGEARPFRIDSDPADIIALVPRASGDDDSAAAMGAASAAAAQVASMPARSMTAEQDAAAATARASSSARQAARDARSGLSHLDAVATHQEADATSSVAQSMAAGHQLSDESRAFQEGQSGHATVRQQAAISSAEIVTRSSSLGSVDYTGSANAEAHQAYAMQRIAAAHNETAAAKASSAWATTVPVIRKWATQNRVVIGERFNYMVEVRNDSAMDLVYAAVLDTLDHRVLANASDVRATPHTKINVNLKDQRLRVEFIGGLRRGRSVTITIPVVLNTDIAEQDKSSVRGRPRR